MSVQRLLLINGLQWPSLCGDDPDVFENVLYSADHLQRINIFDLGHQDQKKKKKRDTNTNTLSGMRVMVLLSVQPSPYQ